MEVCSHSYGETQALGEQLGRVLPAGSILCLDGDLGAGKTALAGGIARGLGISGAIPSPTFSILHIYEGGRLPFYHMDLYRLGEGAAWEDLGLEEYLDGQGLCLVEWASLGGALWQGLEERIIGIGLWRDAGRGEDFRRLVIEGLSEEIEKIIEEKE